MVIGPASETTAISFLGSLKLNGSTGTGLAPPMITGEPPSISRSGMRRLSTGSMCGFGFSVSLPSSFAVGSPRRPATYPWAISCKIAEKIRIIAPIPGKGVVGIEVPNKNRETVFLKDLIGSDTFRDNSSITYVPIGKNITGNPFYYSISLMPHILIAGATGSGKSIFINSVITSLLYRATPEEIRFIMIDPKRIELSVYNGIPHLIRSVINDQSTALKYLLKSLECMEQRYKEFARVGVRNIQGYNSKIKDKKPYIFIIIDEKFYNKFY